MMAEQLLKMLENYQVEQIMEFDGFRGSMQSLLDSVIKYRMSKNISLSVYMSRML